MAENMQNGMVRLKEGGEGRGLFPVLQPQGNPYVESHPTGDVWLQSMWKEGRTTMPACFDGLVAPQSCDVKTRLHTLCVVESCQCLQFGLYSCYPSDHTKTRFVLFG